VASDGTDSPPTPARRGRPRSEVRSRAVLAATLEELIEHGIGGIAIEAVAARAGVSKVTIYRRWPDKIALTLAALEELPELRIPDTGGLIEDLRQLRVELLFVIEESKLGDVLPALMAERRRSQHHDAISRYIEQRSRPFRTIVERAIERGELATSISPDLVAQLISSPLGMSLMTQDEPLSEEEWTTVVSVVVAGIERTEERHADHQRRRRAGERDQQPG